MNVRNSKRALSNPKYNYIQTEPDEIEPAVHEDEYRDSSLDKQYVGISISDSNYNEHQYNDKPH